MLSDPRLYGVVNGIIVEFEDAFYQDTLDRLILGDAPVNDADPCLVWRNTTQSPNIILDAPIYVQTYRRVRPSTFGRSSRSSRSASGPSASMRRVPGVTVSRSSFSTRACPWSMAYCR
jgi:hypothetical protein